MKLRQERHEQRVLLSKESVADMLDIHPSEIMKLIRKRLLPTPVSLIPGQKGKRWVRAEVLKLVKYLKEERRIKPADMPKIMAPWSGWVHPALEPVRECLASECEWPAVYFLLKGECVVYVGSSIEPMKRVHQHATGQDRKDFDSVVYLPVPLEQLLDTEKKFVVLIDPPHNTIWKRHCDVLHGRNGAAKLPV